MKMIKPKSRPFCAKKSNISSNILDNLEHGVHSLSINPMRLSKDPKVQARRASNAAHAAKRSAEEAKIAERKKGELNAAKEAASRPDSGNIVGGKMLSKHEAWWAKYGPIAEEIHEKREERIARRIFRLNMRAEEFGRICELTNGRAVLWRDNQRKYAKEIEAYAGDVGYYAFMEYMKRYCSERTKRMKAAIRRPYYYEAERMRRQELAAKRRKVGRRYTENPCPTREEVLALWLNRRKSHEDAIRFGSCIEDLECYIDNSLMRDDDGVIYGRNSGIKGWLQENIPALFYKYSTIMRYKAAAKKLKQITELKDPTPVAVVVDRTKCDYGADEVADGKIRGGNCVGNDGAEGAGCGIGAGNRGDVMEIEGQDGGRNDGHSRGVEVPSVEVVRARAIWEEVVKGIGPSATALMERINRLCDPERVEEANMLASLRAKYANEITVRTKDVWWRERLGQMA